MLIGALNSSRHHTNPGLRDEFMAFLLRPQVRKDIAFLSRSQNPTRARNGTAKTNYSRLYDNLKFNNTVLYVNPYDFIRRQKDEYPKFLCSLDVYISNIKYSLVKFLNLHRDVSSCVYTYIHICM